MKRKNIKEIIEGIDKGDRILYWGADVQLLYCILNELQEIKKILREGIENEKREK